MKRNASMSSLSHSITCRSIMAAGSIGTRSSSRSWVRTKPPGCWLRWRGAPMSWRARSSARRRRRSERLRFSASTCLSSTPSSDQPQTCEDSILIRSSVSPSALPTSRIGALGAIADHGRAQSGVVAAVLLEDPLHDDLAPLVLEIDVDVRRLAAFLRHEALEQQVIPRGIDGGDAQHVADGASSRRCRGPGRGCPSSARSARSNGPSESRARSSAFRSAEARGGGSVRPRRAGPRDSAKPRLPRSVSPTSPAGSARGRRAPRDIGRPARRAKSGSARRLSTVRASASG